MQKLEGIVAVHPHGDTHVVQVTSSKSDGLSEDQVNSAIKGKKFKLVAFKKA